MTDTPQQEPEMRCEHITFDNLRGTECRLTGVSVPADCGSSRGDALELVACTPRFALQYVAGERTFLASAPIAERDAIIATAGTIRERLRSGGLVLGKERGMRPAKLEAMKTEELEALLRELDAEARRRRHAEKEAAQIIPILTDARKSLLKRLRVLDEELARSKRGEAVRVERLAEAGIKVPSGLRQAVAPDGEGAGHRRPWTDREVAKLMEMSAAGVKVPAIAQELNRTPGACYQALQKARR